MSGKAWIVWNMSGLFIMILKGIDRKTANDLFTSNHCDVRMLLIPNLAKMVPTKWR